MAVEADAPGGLPSLAPLGFGDMTPNPGDLASWPSLRALRGRGGRGRAGGGSGPASSRDAAGRSAAADLLRDRRRAGLSGPAERAVAAARGGVLELLSHAQSCPPGASPSDEKGLAVGEPHRRYTAFVAARAGWTGHLFQGRFASVAMDEDHLLAALRYVALNPVKARLARRPEDWPWSSARALLTGRSTPHVDVAPALADSRARRGPCKRPRR